jgi:hypothetical protein
VVLLVAAWLDWVLVWLLVWLFWLDALCVLRIEPDRERDRDWG